MPRSTSPKRVTVKEDPKTSLAEAGISPMTLKDGMRAVAIAHMYYPHHDRSMVELVLQYLRDVRPEVVFLLGGIIDEDSFKQFNEVEENYLHDYPDTPEVLEAMAAGGFEDQVLKLGEMCGKFIEQFQVASGGKVIYIPSATHLSMPNEIRLMEWIQQTKRTLDAWSVSHPKATEYPSDPSIALPKKLDVLFNLHNNPMVQVQRYGSAVLLNDKTLFMIGDFRRRHGADASNVEWEQRGYNIVRSFDGKVASGYRTSADHTLPGLQLLFQEFHEVGYLWDPRRMGHLRDYDRRASGFFTGIMVHGELFGQSIPVLRGTDGRRSFVVDDRDYTEAEPGCLPNGSEISLEPRVIQAGDGEDQRRIKTAVPSEEEAETTEAKPKKPKAAKKAKKTTRRKPRE
ncbi:MAG: hypothetical protein K2X93_28730 [Candidatus Obscuribacterales bacterium]|nr:hypothetical protein [Candidatus Obscuribacterales bacterium]